MNIMNVLRGEAIPAIRFLTFLISLCGSFAFAMLRVTTPSIVEYYQAWGYSTIFIAFAIWLLCLLPTRAEWEAVSDIPTRGFGPHLLALVLIVLSFSISQPKFHFPDDELNFLGTAFTMYEEHKCYLPTEVIFPRSAQIRVVGTDCDARPLLFPFLISLAHAFLGYSGYNGFVVNAFVGWGSLIVFYFCLKKRFSEWLSLVGMTLLGCFPLFTLWVTSSGCEIVDLFFVLLSFAFLDRFLETPDEKKMERLVFSLVLLAHVRNDSIYYLLFLLIFPILKMRNELLKNISYKMSLLPFLILPVVWRSVNSEMLNNVFHLDFFFKNIRDFFNFFSGRQPYSAVVPPLFYISILGMVCGAVILFTQWRSWDFRVRALIVVIIGVLSGNCAFRVLQFSDNPTFLYAMSNGVVFIPIVIFFSLFAFEMLEKKGIWPRKLVVVAVLGMICWFWPQARHSLIENRPPRAREYGAVLKFLEANFSNKDVLVIAPDPKLYVPHRYSAVKINTANVYPDSYKQMVKTGVCEKLLLVQRISGKTNEPVSENTVSSQFHMVKLYQEAISEEEFVSISEVKADNTNY